MPKGKYIRTEEHKRKIGESMKGRVSGFFGRKHSKESRDKISMSVRKHGKRNVKQGVENWQYGREDEKSNRWKGSKVGYFGLHGWVRKHLGKPDNCLHCGIAGVYKSYVMTKGKRKGMTIRYWTIHWANISRKYKRDLEDWMGLCPMCHVQYDKIKP